MKTLYIIGNGFDLHHDFKTSYEVFAHYLRQNNPKLFQIIVEYTKLQDCNNPWHKFEENLGLLDMESFITQNATTNNELTIFDELFPAFKRFILSVKTYRTDIPLLQLHSKALFFNFNYTSTLEDLYQIEPNNILYIHEKAEHNDTKLLLGHGLDISDSVDSKVYQIGLSNRRKKAYDKKYYKELSSDPIRNAVLKYLQKSFKPTAKIIEQNQCFFNKLADIEEVFVLGHSLSPVDMPYFTKIKKCIKRDAKWTVSFYKPSEEMEHLSTIMSLGVNKENIEIIELKNLQSV